MIKIQKIYYQKILSLQKQKTLMVKKYLLLEVKLNIHLIQNLINLKVSLGLKRYLVFQEYLLKYKKLKIYSVLQLDYLNNQKKYQQIKELLLEQQVYVFKVILKDYKKGLFQNQTNLVDYQLKIYLCWVDMVQVIQYLRVEWETVFVLVIGVSGVIQ